MAISSTGFGAQLDVNGIVTQLIALERRLTNIRNSKEACAQAKPLIHLSVKGAFSSFQNAIAALTTPARLTAVIASTADATVVSVTALGGGIIASFNVQTGKHTDRRRVH